MIPLQDTLSFTQAMGIDDAYQGDPRPWSTLTPPPLEIVRDNGATELNTTKGYTRQNRLTISQKVEKARSLASAAQTLEELHQAISSFEECELKATATHTVFCDGNPKARVMLVGEAPGADEDRLGRPFVGVSGQLLDRMFAAIGLDRNSIYISNMLPWRPPGNRTPTPEETTMCLPFIEKHIALVAPDVLVYIGGVAAKTLLDNGDGISKLRGKFTPYQNAYMSKPIDSIALFHPAYLLRSPSQKRLAWQDLLTLKMKMG